MEILCKAHDTNPVALREAWVSFRVAEVVSALSQALDLGSGATRWHSVRTCILGMRIAAELRLNEDIQAGLYYALLLKDAGCSSNASQMYNALGSDDIAAKRDIKKTDWTRLNWETLKYALTHVASGKPFLERVRTILRITSRQKQHTREVTAIRCERGATMARLMGLPESTAEGIGGLDEHWDGKGNPEGRRGASIPITSRIMLLAQTLDVFYTATGAQRALEVIRERSGTWFDPHVVGAAHSLARRKRLWSGLDCDAPLSTILNLEPSQRTLSEGDISLDAVCQAFAQIVDAKSPFTYNHSNGVANAAVAIARKLEFTPARVLFIRHAALLHDLGKMAVSNAILEKPGKLDAAEWQALRAHPAHTWNILRSISGFEGLSEIAASHHEKLDGSGYHRGLTANQLPLEARILVVADIFDALSAKRPYRDALPLEKVFAIMHSETPHAIDANCLEALQESGIGCDQSFVDVHTLQKPRTQTDDASRPASQETA
ncbi:MAG: HD domain-containing protein [Acidobacteriaceae bacterium]|nr:HD domain-containing protein [Acidobacteriaceae bacterium]